MSARDSGFIDLFAIHQAGRATPAPPPSAPPPAVSFDTGEDELHAFESARTRSRRHAKIAGAAIGAATIFGVLALAIGASSSSANAEKATSEGSPAAAAVPPPPAVTALPATPATAAAVTAPTTAPEPSPADR